MGRAFRSHQDHAGGVCAAALPVPVPVPVPVRARHGYKWSPSPSNVLLFVLPGLQYHLGIPVEDIRLVFGGNPVVDTSTPRDGFVTKEGDAARGFRLSDGAVVHVVRERVRCLGCAILTYSSMPQK